MSASPDNTTTATDTALRKAVTIVNLCASPDNTTTASAPVLFIPLDDVEALRRAFLESDRAGEVMAALRDIIALASSSTSEGGGA